MRDDTQASDVQETLQRLANANRALNGGPGILPGHDVPLAQFHSRRVASMLRVRLSEEGIQVKIKPTRMTLSISVALEDRQKAFEILAAFKQAHPDTTPRRFSRDYDIVFLIAFATIVFTVISFYIPTFTRWTPLAVLITGVSICVLTERWHRSYRYHDGLRFTLFELFALVTMFALNLAVWRIVL